MLDPKLIIGLAVGLAAGTAGGYIYAKHTLTEKIWTEANAVMEKELEYYIDPAESKPTEESAEPEVIVEVETVEGLSVTAGEVEPVDDVEYHKVFERFTDPNGYAEPEPVKTNVFETFGDVDEVVSVPKVDTNGLTKEDLTMRSGDGPYLITDKEYEAEDDESFTKSALVWYAGDGTLCDEEDDPLLDYDGVVGEGTLDRFGTGAGSKYPDRLYVRNPRLYSDFEVVIDERSFSDVLAGMKADSSDD